MKQQSKRLLLPLAAALRLITLTVFLLALPGLAKAQTQTQTQTDTLDVSKLPTDKDIFLTCKSDGWYYSWDGQAETAFNGTLTGTLTTSGYFNIAVDDDAEATLKIIDAKIKYTGSPGSSLFYYDDKNTLTLEINNSNLKATEVFGANTSPIIIRTEERDSCVIDGNVSVGDNGIDVNMTGNILVKGGVQLRGDCRLTVGKDVKVANSTGDAFSKENESATPTYLSPILQWTYATPPAVGELTIKSGETAIATFLTNDTLKSFGIGGEAGKIYTVWYTPKDGSPELQSDADGKSEFKLDDNGLLSSTGMRLGALNLDVLGEQLKDKNITLKYASGVWSYTCSEDGVAKDPTAFNGTLTGTLTTTGSFSISEMDAPATLNIKDAKITGTESGSSLFNCNHPKGTTLTFEISKSTIKALPTFSAPFADSGPVIIKAEGTEPCVIDGEINLTRDALTIDGGTGGGLTVNGAIRTAGEGSTNPDIRITGKIKVNDSVFLSGKCVLTVGDNVQVATSNKVAFSVYKPDSTTYNSPIFQWTYNQPLAEGTLTIKKEGTDLATFTTDGTRRSFGIGGEADKTYTVWYTPNRGQPAKQSDAVGKTEFKLTKDSLLSNTGMKAVGPITPGGSGTDITITGDSTYQEGTGGTTDFNNSIGNGKAPLTIGRLTFAATPTFVSITAKKLTISGPIYVNNGAQAILAFEGENKCNGVLVEAGGTLAFRKQDGVANTITSHNPITNYGTFTDETGQISEVNIQGNQLLKLDRSASSAPIEHVQPGSKITLKVSATLDAGTAPPLSYQWYRSNAPGNWESVQEPVKTKSSGAAQPSAPAYGKSPTLEVSADAAGAYCCQVECSNVSATPRTVLMNYTTVEVKTPDPTEYLVTLPKVKGAITTPPAGGYYVTEGNSFHFTLTVDADYNQSLPVVKANGSEIKPDQSGKYWLQYINAHQTIQITGLVKNPAPVGIEGADKSAPKVWATDGTLYIYTPTPQGVSIYTATGALYKDLGTVSGDTQVTMQKGIYMVVIGDKTIKIAM